MRNRWLVTLAAVLLGPVAAFAQISPTYTFSDGTVISSAQVNANFALLSNALNRTGGTMLGTLTSRDLVPQTTATYDIGATGTRYRDGWFSRNLTVGGNLAIGGTFGLPDTDRSHALLLAAGSDLTADRTLTLVTGNANQTLTLSGNPTLGDWFNQDVKTSAAPTFLGTTLSGTLTTGAVRFRSTGAIQPGAAFNAYDFYLDSSISPQPDVLAAGMRLSPTFVEAGSGTHALLAGLYLDAPIVTAGGASVTTATTLYVVGAPSASGANNYAIRVNGGATSLGGTLAVAGAASFTSGLSELGRAFNAGATQGVSYSSGNFSASGSMTWTVQSGDQKTFSYRRLGDTAWITIDIDEASVGGTPSTSLNITLPLVAAEALHVPCYISDNGTPSLGFGVIASGVSTLQIFKSPVGNWTASTNLNAVSCHLALKVS